METNTKQLTIIDNLENKLQELYNKYWQEYLACDQYPEKLFSLMQSNAILKVQGILQESANQQEPEKITLDWTFQRWGGEYYTEAEYEIVFSDFTVIFPEVYYNEDKEFGFYTSLRVISNDDEVLMECDDMQIYERDYPILAKRVYSRIANFDDESLRFAEVI